MAETTTKAHTPGPWHRDPRRLRCFEIVGPKGEDIGYVNESDGADEPQVYPAEANAHLIAAAPEMLAVLKTMLLLGLTGGEKHVDIRLRELAVAAIAKAEGK